MIKKVSLAKVPSLSRWPSELSCLGSLKYCMGNLNLLVEIKILGGMKKISVMVRHSGLGGLQKAWLV